MNSIDRNQPEKNHEDLTGAEALEKLQELAKGACFFVTQSTGSESEGARPMSVQKVDEEGCIWFFSAIDSYKNRELEADPHVELYFQRSMSEFLHVKGTATILRDKQMIDELWDPMVKAWFTEGKDDPRISLIRVQPTEGHYWDTKHGNFVAGIKILIGAAIGKTTDDGIQGKIRLT